MKELFKALNLAQAQIKGAVKDSTNPHFKSRYADLESVIDAVRGPFAANGLAFIQSESEDGRHMETVLTHVSGEHFVSRVPLIITKSDMQGVGSAITYARRYGLAAAAGLSQTDDDGQAACEPPKHTQKPAPKPITEDDHYHGNTAKTPITDKIMQVAKDSGLKAEVLFRPVFDRNSPKEVNAVKTALAKAKIANSVIREHKESFEEYLAIGRDFCDYDEAVFNFFQHKRNK